MRLTRHAFLAALAAGLSLAAGCRTPPGPDGTAFTQKELQAVFSRAQDPRRFWITVYGGREAPVFTGSNRMHPEHLAQMPFQSPARSGDPVIYVQRDDDTGFHALIDTTAEDCWTDPYAVAGFGVTPLAPGYERKPRHVSSPAAGYAGVTSRMRFDQLNVETVVLAALAFHGPLPYPLNRGADSPHPSLVIGTSLLSAFSFVQIDFGARSAIFAATHEFQPDPDSLVATVPFQRVSGAYAARGMLDNKRTPFLIDTAGDFEVAMAKPATNRLRQVSIGDLVFRQVEVSPSSEFDLGLPSYPRIGRRLLSRFKVTFENKQGVIYFEKPSGRKKSR